MPCHGPQLGGRPSTAPSNSRWGPLFARSSCHYIKDPGTLPSQVPSFPVNPSRPQRGLSTSTPRAAVTAWFSLPCPPQKQLASTICNRVLQQHAVGQGPLLTSSADSPPLQAPALAAADALPTAISGEQQPIFFLHHPEPAATTTTISTARAAAAAANRPSGTTTNTTTTTAAAAQGKTWSLPTTAQPDSLVAHRRPATASLLRSRFLFPPAIG
ncbi:hypothetical protein ACCO45_001816 [Purpureocillium lilacinum]|uniref:Uncharacterized protein n=1 Tax=Purpureocillium lilacinum TaxID=33203 RepID=A0ACC4E984_PURLI